MKLKVKKLHPDAILPTKNNPEDSGFDLYALEDTVLLPGETSLIKTGIAFEIDKGFEIQVRPRSGMSLKTKFRVANAPGTVDSTYNGDCSVIGFHAGNESGMFGLLDVINIKKGDRIAQAVLCPVILAELEEIQEFTKVTERQNKGFGSSGV